MRAKSLALLALLGCTRSAPSPSPDGAPSAAPSALAPSASAPSTSAPLASAPSASAPEPSASAAPAAPPSLPAAAVTAIDEAASGAVSRDEVPGAVVAVVLRRGPAEPASLVFLKAYGLRSKVPSARRMTMDTVFDLASLSKAVATAPAVHVLVEEGKLSLAAPVARYLPSFARRGKDAITVAELLLHTGGLIADDAMSDYQGTRAAIYARLDALAPVSEPGSKFEYSDVGYIVLGELVEKVSGQPLDVFVRERIFAPLGMVDTAYNPGLALVARAAPTEPRDGEMLLGKVHDPRAAALGGVAGHAGVFSTAADLARFAVMLLGNGSAGAARILGPEAFARMVAPQDLPGGGRRSPGWDVQTGFSGARGELSGGYGHTGFTGTSLWVDPALGVAVIVLSNRLHPDGKGDPRRLRREVATAVARALQSGGAPAEATPAPAPAPAGDDGGALPPPNPPAKVLTGIDVLERDGFSILKGKRVGLVTNPSGLDAAGQRTVDVLFRAPGVTLAALFSPEHGLGGAADGDVGDGVEPRTKLPVYSLYGKRTRPTAAQLTGLDVLVFDLVDAGARFFTFETTLGYLLETAAEHHLPLVVLDRPNPIGGVAVEGPVLDPSRTSFIGYHPLPIRHGLTLGELAGLFNKERSLGADLHVVRVEGWRRADDLAAAGVRWVNPSPNLRSVDEALLYPGVALVEATNVSVGRGTPHPFEQVGAPWIDGGRLAAALAEKHLPGVRFVATTFTPETSVYAGERCQGVLLQVTDRAHLEPVRTGLSIAGALLHLHRERWESKNLALLLGHPPTFTGLLRGDTPEALAAAWEPGLLAFRELRKKYLLYPEP
jgi:uncharacterized protein YbbC (DUF1343 family)/CubicO group peptidase (beta-lactamase class C family)